jgi:endoglucanase
MSPSLSASLASALSSLLPAFGPPGRETGVRDALKRLLRGAGTFSEDATGNLHVHRSGGGPRLLVTAHMDAPGIIVTRFDPDSGQARLAILGGRRALELVGATVRFADGRSALVGLDRPGPGKDGAEPDGDALLLETGLGVGKGAKAKGAKAKGTRPLDVGDVAALEDRPLRLGDLWCAANLDNRAGCAALAEAMKRARRVRYDLHAVFSAQSDLGARGATTGAYGADPEVAIVVDVAHVGEAKESSGFAVGKGPCVGLKEPGYLAHPEALELVRRSARAARVPLQYLIRENEGSDARVVRATRTGVPTALIAIPARRLGGVWSLAHARDMAQTADLIAAILTTAPRVASAAKRPARRARGVRR